MDERLQPTLFILIAPPAVGFIAYVELVGGLDAFARVLYYTGLFLTVLLLTQLPRLARLNFYLSWWAYSFPLAAITIATLMMYQTTSMVLFSYLSFILLGLLTITVSYLLIKTLTLVIKGRICVPD